MDPIATWPNTDSAPNVLAEVRLHTDVFIISDMFNIYWTNMTGFVLTMTQTETTGLTPSLSYYFKF